MKLPLALLGGVAISLGTLGASAPALALTQPDNTVIPVGSGLQGLFDSRAETLSALSDAQIVPETFTPTCKLEFEVLQRNAGYQNSFGWYNVTGQKPTPEQLFQFLACNDPVGTKKPLSIKNDPNYLGGDIGFYEATGGGCPTPQSHESLFFSERKYNPDGSQQNPYIHLIIYNSTVTPKAFYFAWEDLLSGGDNDFDDLTTFVTGISCTGGGGACKTGQLGVCADGTLQCQNGVLSCLPLSEPSSEVCDGLDNDCSGVVDEGNLCPEFYVCDKGTCVPECGSVEHPCLPGKVCNPDGICVDPGCLEITCPESTKCIAGKCVGPCDDVVCPYAQVCLVGSCVDPCTKFECDDDQVCQAGACVEKCQCAGCKANESCQPDGRCIPAACENVTCPAGSHCGPDGGCLDDCAGAQCPSGEKCELGLCVPDPNAGQGGEGGEGGTVFNVGGEGGGGGEGGASTSSSGQGGAGASPVAAGESSGGCGCHTPATTRAAPRWWLLAASVLGVLVGRRRSRVGASGRGGVRAT